MREISFLIYMKTSEIFVGVIIASLLLFGFYKYLQWGKDMIDLKEVAAVVPAGVSASDKATLEKYGAYIPNRLMIDSYNQLNYWRLYYTTVYFGA